jgi:hypothetical protein
MAILIVFESVTMAYIPCSVAQKWPDETTLRGHVILVLATPNANCMWFSVKSMHIFVLQKSMMGSGSPGQVPAHDSSSSCRG